MSDLVSLLDIMAFLTSELLLFAAIWFFIGAIDDLAIDIIWCWHKINRRNVVVQPPIINDQTATKIAPIAIFVPAWREAGVIGHMVRHCRNRWAAHDFRLYVGSYLNDPATHQAAKLAAQGDPRIRLVVHERPGPTSKADCLNRIWRAMVADEAASGICIKIIMLHDAEDLVHRDALRVISPLIGAYDFVQLPVIPLMHPDSKWISGHYCDEFAEAHGKAMVVRNNLSAAIPAAGVGCAFSRDILAQVSASRNAGHGAPPFAADSVTEDYELGLHIHQINGRGLFLRQRDADGEWIATRAFFPSSLTAAIIQKSRWMTGISLAGWDRLGWAGNIHEHWMRLRDRRAILAALVLSCAYLALVTGTILSLVAPIGHALDMTAMAQWQPQIMTPLLALLLQLNLLFLGWRLVMRCGFTTAQYGGRQGLMAIPRLFISNIIAILAARRALFAYVASLWGCDLKWDKTDHAILPFIAPEPVAMLRRPRQR